VNDHDGSVAMGDEDGGYESEEDAQADIDAHFKQFPGTEDELSIEEREFTPEGPTEEQIDNWRSEVESAIGIVDESPV
jgi:hypothetical protein